MGGGGGGGGGGKDGSISQIAQGCQPGTRQILKVGTLGYQNQLKKKLYMKKKRFSPKSSFLCRTIIMICSVPKLSLCVFDNWLCHLAAIVIWYLMKFHKLICMVITVTANGKPLSWALVARIGTKQNGVKTRGGGGGGHSGTQGDAPFVTYFADEGVFFKDLRMSAIL